MFESFFTLIFGLGVSFGVCILIRGILIWYFKNDTIISELQLQNNHLKVLVGFMMHDQSRKDKVDDSPPIGETI